MSEKSLTIIATKGTLDWAYPPFILSSTAAALGYNVTMFFTFYGLQLLKKDLSLSVSPLGNPHAHAHGNGQVVPRAGHRHSWDASHDDRHDEKHHQNQRCSHRGGTA